MINSTTKKRRQSNIELLRIISILLILVTHADFWALGEPSYSDLASDFMSGYTRIFIESLSIICVNIFVLISGWFTIRASLKSILKLLFQVYFLLIAIYLIYILLRWDTINLRSISQCFIFGHEFWFIKAYLGLLILSPVLNTFANNVSEKVFRIVLIVFLSYQCIYGWITPGAWFLHYGYSVTSFAGLYLLARYIKLYVIENENENGLSLLMWCKKQPKIFYLLMFFGLTFLNSIMYLLGYYLPIVGLHVRTMAFAISNPIIILQSLSLLLYFHNLKVRYTPTINILASSSLSVFILQSSQNATLYKNIINHVFNNYNGLGCMMIIFSIIIVYFIIGILLDQVRKYLWNKIEYKVPDVSFYDND